MLNSQIRESENTSLETKNGLERQRKVSPNVNKNDVKKFLTFVAEGEQDKAEAMLQNNPALVLVPGDVADLSKRTFKAITGFQYAVWALDWHMWTKPMITLFVLGGRAIVTQTTAVKSVVLGLNKWAEHNFCYQRTL